MRNRWMGGLGLFTAGVVTGLALAGLEVPVVSAQGNWQCRTFALESTQQSADAIGPWLGAAAHVEISTAGLEVANRYILVACKQ